MSRMSVWHAIPPWPGDKDKVLQSIVYWSLCGRRASSSSFRTSPTQKNGVRHTWPEPRFDMFLHCLIAAPEQAPSLLQIKAIVLHHLGPCRDEVIGELVMRIIGCIDFCNGTQLRV